MPEENARPDTQDEVRLRDNILNNIDVAVYVSDMASNRILFVNAELARLHKNVTLIGEICWEALKDKNGRCDFCPIPYLLKHPGRKYHWETRRAGKHYLICDSIIPWTKGKLAHMQYMTQVW